MRFPHGQPLSGLGALKEEGGGKLLILLSTLEGEGYLFHQLAAGEHGVFWHWRSLFSLEAMRMWADDVPGKLAPRTFCPVLSTYAGAYTDQRMRAACWSGN